MTRSRHLFVLVVLSSLLSPNFLHGAVRSATWGTDPAAPVYAGQEYELTLTLVTEKNEEISGYHTAQGPKRSANSQTVAIKDNLRHTTLRWQMTDPRPKRVALPEGPLRVSLTTSQMFGFMRTATTTQQELRLPAFSYEVIDLPGEAKGAPIGHFVLRLAADTTAFRTGEVRLLTATLEAQAGRIPEAFAFSLEAPSGGRIYPFREIARSPRRLVAQAYFVTEAEQNIRLRLSPFKAFDLGSRTLTEVRCPTLTLRWRPESEPDDSATVAVGAASASGLPLRFAPSERAPIIDILPEALQATREAPLERHGDWVRVYGEGRGTGWIRHPQAPREKETP